MSHLNDMIKAARERNPVALERAFTAEMTQRMGTAITERKADVVAKMFGVTEEVNTDVTAD